MQQENGMADTTNRESGRENVRNNGEKQWESYKKGSGFGTWISVVCVQAEETELE